VDLVEQADLGRVPDDASPLKAWLDQVKLVLPAVADKSGK